MGFFREDEEASICPKIVVVGEDQVGKSSLIESLVKKKIFPKMSRVTERPVVITMEKISKDQKDFVQFDCPTKVLGTRLDEDGEFIADIIQKCMKMEDDRSPVILKMSSSDVTEELTVVDLPSIRKLADHDGSLIRRWVERDHVRSPKDINWQMFLEDEDNLILAVCPANNLEKLKSTLEYVTRFDPQGIRTIGIVTMLDVTPATTELTSILTNQKHPLKRGYYGVINRNENDLKNDLRLQEARVKEQEFFHTHQVYGSSKLLRNRMGSDHLAPHLMHLINECRKLIKNQIQSEMRDDVEELREVGIVDTTSSSDIDSASKATFGERCASCCFPCLDDGTSTLTVSSETPSMMVASSYLRPPPQLPLKDGNGEELTVEIVFQGLPKSLNPPIFRCDAMALDGPNYQIAVNSPESKRKADVSPMKNATDTSKDSLPTSQECSSISGSTNSNSHIIKLADDTYSTTKSSHFTTNIKKRIKPWQCVEKETFNQSVSSSLELSSSDASLDPELMHKPIKADEEKETLQCIESQSDSKEYEEVEGISHRLLQRFKKTKDEKIEVECIRQPKADTDNEEAKGISNRLQLKFKCATEDKEQKDLCNEEPPSRKRQICQSKLGADNQEAKVAQASESDTTSISDKGSNKLQDNKDCYVPIIRSRSKAESKSDSHLMTNYCGNRKDSINMTTDGSRVYDGNLVDPSDIFDELSDMYRLPESCEEVNFRIGSSSRGVNSSSPHQESSTPVNDSSTACYNITTPANCIDSKPISDDDISGVKVNDNLTSVDDSSTTTMTITATTTPLFENSDEGSTVSDVECPTATKMIVCKMDDETKVASSMLVSKADENPVAEIDLGSLSLMQPGDDESQPRIKLDIIQEFRWTFPDKSDDSDKGFSFHVDKVYDKDDLTGSPHSSSSTTSYSSASSQILE